MGARTAQFHAYPHGALAAHLEGGARRLAEDDTVTVTDVADPAPPGLAHPLLAALRERNGLEVTAKLGWTDVSRFAAAGIPATNFGPGDATLAHSRDERVDRASLDAVFSALGDLLRNGV